MGNAAILISFIGFVSTRYSSDVPTDHWLLLSLDCAPGSVYDVSTRKSPTTHRDDIFVCSFIAIGAKLAKDGAVLKYFARQIPAPYASPFHKKSIDSNLIPN